MLRDRRIPLDDVAQVHKNAPKLLSRILLDLECLVELVLRYQTLLKQDLPERLLRSMWCRHAAFPLVVTP